MCRFTCNTGYRPQGIDTRFCQNDGWNGTDLDFACFQGLDQCSPFVFELNVLVLVTCPPLGAPDNGLVTCTLGDNGVITVGDSCWYTCDSSFESQGSATRKCQNDGA